MYRLKAYLNPVSGGQQFDRVKLLDREAENNVRAVYISGLSKEILNTEFGAGIEIATENITTWTAIHYPGAFWCVPGFGTALKDIPDKTQCLLYKKADHTYGVIFPVVSEDYKCILCGGEDVITAKMYSLYEMTDCKGLAFVYSEGENLYKLLENCAKTAVKLLHNTCRTRAQRRYPEIFEYLGWCSWDAIPVFVTEDELLAKCAEFQDKNIPVKWAIIDDMLSEIKDFEGQLHEDNAELIRLIHSSKLYSFQADTKRFPNGLKSCIDKMKETGIKQVGAWQPVNGYWGGIDPKGEVYRDNKEHIIRTDFGMYIPNYRHMDSYAYYNALHDYLTECGIDMVKIDNQSQLDGYYAGLASIGQFSREFHAGMEASVGRHFDNQMINCMGMAAEDMWNRSVSPISRCSGDFLPEDKAWFTEHIIQCSYNDLMQGQLYYCDWDMWWTDDGQAVKNSVLRAVSGGPVYVSDKTGRSNRDILMPLVLEDGRILRCDKPAVPTLDCIFDDPRTSGRLFKLQNTCNDCGVMTVFNLDAGQQKVSGSISPSDIEGLKGEQFAVYEHFSEELTILDYDGSMELTLQDGDAFKLYILVPIKDGFAPIGLVDKFISPKTVKGVWGREVALAQKGRYAVVEDGELVFKMA